jgi:hypothetical protein
MWQVLFVNYEWDWGKIDPSFLCSPPADPADVRSPGLASDCSGALLSNEALCTPDISDMEEDLMSYEMDFQSDISSIL